MTEQTRTDPSKLIASLNAIHTGDLERVKARLEEGARACLDMGRDDLQALLVEGKDALSSGDLKTFRKRVETVVARLGHLR